MTEHKRNHADGDSAVGRAIQRAMGPAISGMTGSSTLPQNISRFRDSAGKDFKDSAGKQFYVVRA